MAAGESDGEGVSKSGSSSLNGSLSLAEPVACAGSSSPLLCSDAIPRDGNQQQSEQVCVVCHYFPLSRALLPCKFLYIFLQLIIFFIVFTHSTGRHTCVCAVCFCKYRILRTVKLAIFFSLLHPLST